jgi:hypothetical protein
MHQRLQQGKDIIHEYQDQTISYPRFNTHFIAVHADFNGISSILCEVLS